MRHPSMDHKTVAAPSRLTHRMTPIVMTILLAACGGAAQSSARQVDVSAEPESLRPPSMAATPTTPTSPAGPSPVALPSTAVESALPVAWEQAGPSAERSWTWTPAVDPEGRVWAASSFDDVFWIFDREGTFLEAWGTPGRDEGEFRLNDGTNGYGAIAFRPDGGFYVADSGNSRIQQFDADRKLVRTWGAFGTEPESFISPIGIELDGAGEIYVFDDNGRGELKQFGPEGTFRRIVASAVGPYMGVAPDGTIVAFDHLTEALVRIAPDGSRTLALDIGALITFATDIAITPNGRFFVASSTGGGSVFEYEHLIELTSDGDVAHVWPDGAEGIALDPAGDRAYLTFSNLNPAIRAVELPGS